jgi:hypothetical protein
MPFMFENLEVYKSAIFGKAKNGRAMEQLNNRAIEREKL